MTIGNPARRRHYVRFITSWRQLETGPWLMFHYVHHVLLREHTDSTRIVYRHHEETPVGITSVFEVMP
jgi:hypothetical protein